MLGSAPLRRSGRRYLAALGVTPVIIGVRLALWMLPSWLILRLVRRLAISRRPRPVGARVSPVAIAAAVSTASRRLPHASCLTQAIAALLILRAFGYDGRLRIGVGRSPSGDFLAHAWLERDGLVLVGHAAASHVVPLANLACESDLVAEGVDR